LNYSYAFVQDHTGVITNSVVYSTVNQIQSIANNHNGTYTLHLLGTTGAQYYVVQSANIRAPMSAWTPIAGSTNTVANVDGTWTCTVSNSAPVYYRAIAVNPAP
jgi:hypothetical protein